MSEKNKTKIGNGTPQVKDLVKYLLTVNQNLYVHANVDVLNGYKTSIGLAEKAEPSIYDTPLKIEILDKDVEVIEKIKLGRQS